MTENEKALERLLEEEMRRAGAVTDHLFNKIKQLEAETEAQAAHVKDLVARLENSTTTVEYDLSYQRKLEGALDAIRAWADAWDDHRESPTYFGMGYFSAIDTVRNVIKNKLEG